MNQLRGLISLVLFIGRFSRISRLYSRPIGSFRACSGVGVIRSSPLRTAPIGSLGLIVRLGVGGFHRVDTDIVVSKVSTSKLDTQFSGIQ